MLKMQVFKKQLMIDRIRKEGLLNQLTPDIIEIMDKLYGKKVRKNDWLDLIYDVIEYVAYDDEGKKYPINANDVVDIYPNHNKNNERDER